MSTSIPDSIDLSKLQALASNASSGVSSLDAHDLFVLCDAITGELNHLIDQVDNCVSDSIDHSRWGRFEAGRLHLKAARRSFKKAVQT